MVAVPPVEEEEVVVEEEEEEEEVVENQPLGHAPANSMLLLPSQCSP